MLLENIDLTKKFNKAAKLWAVKCDECLYDSKRTYNQLKASESRWNGKHICKSCATRLSNFKRAIENPDSYKRSGDGMRKHAGKSLEEIVGCEQAAAMKKQYSIASSGKNNPNYGGKYSRGFADHPLTGKWEDIFGPEKAAAMKANMSVKNSGSGNPMYGVPTPKKAGNGISGYYKEHYFRSLLELSAMLLLEEKGIIWESAEKACHRIPYVIDNHSRTYTPDFYLPLTDEYWEVKPSNLVNSKEVILKMQAACTAGKNIKLVTDEDIMKIQKPYLLMLIEQKLIKIDETKQWRI